MYVLSSTCEASSELQVNSSMLIRPCS